MNVADDKQIGVGQRIERLICRCLDGEAGAEERAELADILARDEAARALFEEYKQIDTLAADALRHDLTCASPATMPGRYHGWRLGIASALLAAAAVVALFFLPTLWSTVDPTDRHDLVMQDDRVPPRVMNLVDRPSVRPQFVNHPVSSYADYQEVDHQPSRRLRDLRRDLIGIRPDKNKNVIYIFERDTHSTRLVPVSGDI